MSSTRSVQIRTEIKLVKQLKAIRVYTYCTRALSALCTFLPFGAWWLLCQFLPIFASNVSNLIKFLLSHFVEIHIHTFSVLSAATKIKHAHTHARTHVTLNKPMWEENNKIHWWWHLDSEQKTISFVPFITLPVCSLLYLMMKLDNKNENTTHQSLDVFVSFDKLFCVRMRVSVWKCNVVLFIYYCTSVRMFSFIHIRCLL